MGKKKLAVVTGVTRGLGRAMLDRFHELDWMVAGCGRSVEAVEELRRQFGDAHHFSVVDVADQQEVGKWAEEVIQRFGPPDMLINNASIVNENNPLFHIEEKEFATIMDVNVNGVFRVIRAFVPAMMERANGVVVNISSYWGRHGEGMLAPYCASKFAVEGLSQSLAKELPDGMAVVALDPGGSIDTAMLRQCSPEDVEAAPTPEAWSRVAVPFLLQIGPKENGRSLTCPRVY